MDAQADTAAAQRRRARGETDEKEPEGGLRASFARNDLNDMSVDLSAQLNRPKAATGGAAGGGERVVRPKKRKSGYAAKPPSSVRLPLYLPCLFVSSLCCVIDMVGRPFLFLKVSPASGSFPCGTLLQLVRAHGGKRLLDAVHDLLVHVR